MTKYIYARVSSKGSDHQNQIGLLKDKFGDDCIVIKELKSGRKTRPKLMELLTQTADKGDVVYVLHSDRLTRSGIGDLFNIYAVARKEGVQLVSYHEGELGNKGIDAMEELLLAIKATIAFQESLATSRRIKDMFARRAKEGKLSGVYLVIANGNHRHAHKEIDPKIAAATPRIHELRASGMAYRKIAEAVHREFGHKIALSHVHRILNRQAS